MLSVIYNIAKSNKTHYYKSVLNVLILNNNKIDFSKLLLKDY